MGLTRQRSRSDGHWWYRSILISSMTCSGLSLLLQFVGFVTPGWIVLILPTRVTVSAGVWYIQVCSDGIGRCKTASMTRIVNPFNVASDSNEEFINWIELQVEMTLALVACIVTVIMSINSLINMLRQPKSYLCWGVISAILSAGLLLIPICRMANIILTWDSHIRYGLPYSLVFTGLGCLCALFTAVLDLVAMCMIIKDVRTERLRSPEEFEDLTLHPK